MASLSQPIRLEEGEEDQSPEPCANLSPSRSRGDFPLGSVPGPRDIGCGLQQRVVKDSIFPCLCLVQ